MTIIIVQTIQLFIKNELEVQQFLISLTIESVFIFVIIKIYDEIGCNWESIKTIPVSKKNKETQSAVQNNYYYNSTSNLKTRFCPNCGMAIIKNTTQTEEEFPIGAKYCKNCGYLLEDINSNQNLEGSSDSYMSYI